MPMLPPERPTRRLLHTGYLATTSNVITAAYNGANDLLIDGVAEVAGSETVRPGIFVKTTVDNAGDKNVFTPTGRTITFGASTTLQKSTATVVGAVGFAKLVASFGQTLPAALPAAGPGSLVPEPASIGLLALAAGAALRRRSRR